MKHNEYNQLFVHLLGQELYPLPFTYFLVICLQYY